MKKKLSKISLLFLDVIQINLAYLLAIYIRFEGIITTQLPDLTRYLSNAIYITIIKLGIYHYFKMYKIVWRYASRVEIYNIITAIVLSNASALSFLFIRQSSLTRSIYILTTLIDLALIGGFRFYLRDFERKAAVNTKKNPSMNKSIIIGAGDAGVMLIREYRNHVETSSEPVVIIDDDIKKYGKIIDGIPVVGGRQSILSAVDNYNVDEIIIAIPSASKNEIREIIDICKETRCKLKILPGTDEITVRNVGIDSIRDVEIGDLLGREGIRVNIDEVSAYITNKTVMVTRGGDSIGLELCRQIAGFKPKELIILNISVSSSFDIQSELKRVYNDDLNIKVINCSLEDRSIIEGIFKLIKPEVVFHLAAHKLGPLIEENPKETIKKNVFGTLNLVQAADMYDVKKFVMISTDKAANPTNIMEASKRICEMIIQSINMQSNTEYVAVRFGNVLTNNGKLISQFKKQIEKGGPVTVTHQDIIGYFMTKSEAVQLVIQAGAMGEGGEIFIFDMGNPVKIIDLAKDLIRLSGFEPGVDIKVEITGLKSNESFLGDLLLEEEGIITTKHDKIFIGNPNYMDYRLLIKYLEELKRLIKEEEEDDVINYVRHLVPKYRGNEEVYNNRKINM